MKPLEGVVVLDLTRVLAGPYCTMILSDLGAEIIKIELPGTGDDSRGFGPFINNRSLYFLSINRGKKSLSLNLKTEQGKEILRNLVKQADVLVENYRPGTMEKLGLGYASLKEINPRLIYASSSGFGYTGDYSKKPSYDILAQAMGGIMSITGWPDSPPTRVGMSLGDITASLFTAIGINAALYQRAQTSEGQMIDVAMLDCQVSILENALVRYQAEQQNPAPLGNRHPTISPFQAYRASDEYFVVAVGNDALWKSFCLAIEHEELLMDERFASNKLRCENLAALNSILDAVFAQRTASDWLKIMETALIPSAPINDIEAVMNEPQVLQRKMIVEVEDKIAGKIKIAGNPLKMSSLQDSSTREAPPEIGEHNREILSRYLGMTDSEIQKLTEQGVL